MATEADNRNLENLIKTDASVGINLLMPANSAAFGGGRRIDSLNQALMLLGRNQLLRWLQIVLYMQSPSGNSVVPLLNMAAMRGKMMELMSNRLWPVQAGAADSAFTVGIMSLLDSLLGMSMEEVLERIAVNQEIGTALLERQGQYGAMLTAVEHFEKVDGERHLLPDVLKELQIDMRDFAEIGLTALFWINSMQTAVGTTAN